MALLSKILDGLIVLGALLSGALASVCLVANIDILREKLVQLELHHQLVLVDLMRLIILGFGLLVLADAAQPRHASLKGCVVVVTFRLLDLQDLLELRFDLQCALLGCAEHR